MSAGEIRCESEAPQRVAKPAEPDDVFHRGIRTDSSNIAPVVGMILVWAERARCVAIMLVTSSVRLAAPGGRSAKLGKVDALPALREVAGRQARKQGEGLLGGLDRLRLGLLAGMPQRAQLVRLNRLLGERLERVEDPRLAAIVEEIVLRAVVELAKLER